VTAATRNTPTHQTIAGFWDERARTFARADAEGWSAVCHRGAPEYFNAFLDWSQHRALRPLLSAITYRPGDPAVDVGCGTGRWTRVLHRLGLDAKGFDVAPGMVERARELSPDISFEVAAATELPLATASQQVVTCVTVLHHLAMEEQELASAEIARVLRPGGWCITISLLNTLPAGAWCFPRDRAGWVGLFEANALIPVLHLGEEFLTPGILVPWVVAGCSALLRGPSSGSDRWVGSGAGPVSALYRIFHRTAVLASYPLEAAASRWFPTAPACGLASLWRKEGE
jgi:2-polyprenyl-3-methyl-5-hydroxy-6-metoxy-1,4-benzoquinol methylase